MDKLLQNDGELQDEELYALLDKALESDRLCVSEELIQKTLRRVEEEETSKVVSLEQKRKKKSVYSFMKYACVAAAAMLVLVVGVRTFSGKQFEADSIKQETAADGMYMNSGGYGLTQDSATLPREESEATAWPDDADDGSGRGEIHYSKAERDGQPDAADVAMDLNEDAVTPLSGSEVQVSAQLGTALKEMGYEILTSEADYWEFVQRKAYWEEELLRRLAAQDFNKVYPQDGGYSYVLLGKSGKEYTVYSIEPLDAITGMETEGGMLWILFGQNVSLYEE